MSREKFKLPKESISMLEEMEEDIQDLQDEIKRAENVGIPLEDVKEKLNEALKLREGLLKEYR